MVIGLKLSDTAGHHTTLRVELVEHCNAAAQFANSLVSSARKVLNPPCGGVWRLVTVDCSKQKAEAPSAHATRHS